MNLTKCDKCKKIKKERLSFLNNSDWINGSIRAKNWINFDLCGKCGASLLKYIKKYLNVHESEKSSYKKRI